MANIIVKCPECNALVAGPTQAQANRNLGLHRRSKHGYQSPEYAEAKAYREQAKARKALPQSRLDQLAKAREARWGARRSKTPEEVAAKRKAYQIRYRKLHPYKSRKAMAQQVNNAPDAAVPCKLGECPNCHSRFYLVKGDASMV